MSEQWELTTEEPESLEITEDDTESSPGRDEASHQPERRDRIQQSNYLLASVVVDQDEDEDGESCPLWTRGLQRSFKVGWRFLSDFKTVK